MFVFSLSPLDGSATFLLDDEKVHSPDKSLTLETVSSVTLLFAVVDKKMVINEGVTRHAGGGAKTIPTPNHA